MKCLMTSINWNQFLCLQVKCMKEIELKPLHPKNKNLLYSRYVQPKLAWHLTITSISKTWLTENLDSTFVQYICQWLELPIAGTLSNVYLTSNKFGVNIIPPSTKLIATMSNNYLVYFKIIL